MKIILLATMLAIAAAVKFGAPFPECTNCIQSAELHVPIIIDGATTYSR